MTASGQDAIKDLIKEIEQYIIFNKSSFKCAYANMYRGLGRMHECIAINKFKTLCHIEKLFIDRKRYTIPSIVLNDKDYMYGSSASDLEKHMKEFMEKTAHLHAKLEDYIEGIGSRYGSIYTCMFNLQCQVEELCLRITCIETLLAKEQYSPMAQREIFAKLHTHYENHDHHDFVLC